MPQAVHTEERILHDLDHIPVFATEAEEAAYWDDHDLGPTVLARMGSLPADTLPLARPRTASIDLDFDAETLQRLRALAARRHVRYRELIQRFVAERLAEEELRDGGGQRHNGRHE